MGSRRQQQAGREHRSRSASIHSLSPFEAEEGIGKNRCDR